jgi:hypothetical protein
MSFNSGALMPIILTRSPPSMTNVSPSITLTTLISCQKKSLEKTEKQEVAFSFSIFFLIILTLSSFE